jgi:hypothetical protein
MTFKNFTLWLAIGFCTLSVKAQKIDSLERLLVGKTGIDRAIPLIELGYEYLGVNLNKSAECGFEAYKIGVSAKDSLVIVDGERLLAYALRIQGKLDSCMALYSHALAISMKKKFTHQIVKITNGYAIAHIEKANYDKALSIYFGYLDMPESKTDSSTLGSVFNNIGLIYMKLSDFKKSLLFFKKSLEVKQRQRKLFDLDQLYLNMAFSYLFLHDKTNAEVFTKRCLAICGQQCSNLISSQVDFIYGLIEFEANNIKAAEPYFLGAYAKAKDAQHIRFQLDNIDYLSNLYLKSNETELALKYLREAEKLIRPETPYRLELIKIYMRFYEVFRKKKDFQRTAHYQQKYIELRDSIYNEVLTSNLMSLEADYMEKENKMRLESQAQLMLLQEEVIQRQGIINLFIGSMALLLFLLAFVLIRSNRQRKRMNYILEEKVKQRTRQLQESYDSMLRSNEEHTLVAERASLDIKSSVLTLKGLCSVAIHDLKDERTNEYISKMSLTTDQIMEELKRFQNLTQLSALEGKHFLKQ